MSDLSLSQLTIKMHLSESSKEGPHVFCDMDQVLADFTGKIVSFFKLGSEREVKKFLAPPNGWDIVTEKLPNVFEVLQPMPDAKHLVTDLTKLRDAGRIRLSVLTALPVPWTKPQQKHLGDAAREHKRQWIAKHFPSIGASKVITCRRADKGFFGLADLVATGISPILIDDNKSNIKDWKRVTRGVAILHTSAADSLKQLRAELDR